MNLTEKINKIVSQKKLICPNDAVLVCVSGGPDSVALFHLLMPLRKKIQFQIGVAHFNHAIRDEADEEEYFVKMLAEKYTVPFFTEKKDIPKLSNQTGESLETIARQYRYDFFYSISEKEHYNKLALAHNKDDNIETFLMRIFVGTGLQGLESIPEINKIIIRPLLSISKFEILEFLNQNQYEYKIDKSNFDVSYPRNFIRHNIIPDIKKKYKNFDNNIINLIDIIKNENAFFDTIIKQFKKKFVSFDDEGIEIDVVGFQNQQIAIQRRILYDIMKSPTFYKINQIIQHLNSNKENQILLQEHNVSVLKENNKILILNQMATPKSFEYSVNNVPTTLPIPEIKKKVTIVIIKKTEIKNIKEKNCVFLDFDKLQFPISIRNRRKGDRMNHKKLKKFFIDRKIPNWKKDRIPLIISNKRIISIFFNVAKKEKFNYIINDFLIHNTTRTVLKIQIQDCENDSN